jgi:hypothetical protein
LKNRWIQLLAVALPTWGLGYVSERTGFFWFGPLGVALSAAMAWYAFGGGTAGLHALGFERPRSWAWTIGGALLTAIGVHIAISLAAIVVIPRWGPPNFGAFKNLHGHPLELLKFLVIIWTTAAFGEEIIFRGFLIRWLTNNPNISIRGPVVLATVVAATIFGIGHSYQGVSGAILAGAGGLVYGLSFVHARGNLWRSVIGHGLYDTAGFLILYFQGVK